MFRTALLQLVLAASLVSGHILITYPGTRGNNFITNDTFPFGMQWTHPCGGLGLSRNRTYWPTTGGTVAFQPGWFSGHATALLYINIGIDTDGPDGGPLNYTTPLVKPWQLLGPSNGPYPGTLCIEDIAVPEALGVKPGDNATIQIVELANHGASLFACSDIIFVEPGDSRLPPLNDSVCFNTTELGFGDLYTVTTKKPVFLNGTKSSSALRQVDSSSALRLLAGLVPAVVGGLSLFL
ncbi:Uncharacterized protein SAPIO_CDS3347 [Scedosporium apiospermum]|uniref:Copper acquisition factor BIM1-like domain-containing protein n=1 Tax=Pseudallescheria apiosperma TaxID=563466 RepID=A0A084GAK4_PSEDA|nr:Uncharacterized protein SAPIO_CDS3347 [Scedosporium apiospermum]KEZ44366.1 Uncharacterized protein SAPIO_CDS3347 [Scedosporium apiospermum]